MRRDKLSFIKGILYLSICFLVIALTFLAIDINHKLDGHKENWSVITTEGKQTVEVIPDKALLQIEITEEGEDQRNVKQKVSETSVSVQERLQGYGIDEKHIKTKNLQVDQYESMGPQPYSNKKSKTIYRMKTAMDITVDDLDLVEELTNDLIQVEGLTINNLDYQLDDLEKIKEGALSEATKKAREKAEKMAKSLGVDIVGVQSVNQSGDNGYIGIMKNQINSAPTLELDKQDGKAIGVYKGEEKVEIKVTVNFYIE